MKASHQDYEEIDRLSQLVTMAVNPGIFGLSIDMPEPEYQALLATLKSELYDKLDGGIIRDYLDS